MSDAEWECREPPEWLDDPVPAGVFDAVTHPGDAAAALAVHPPGGAATAALAALRLDRLDPTEQIDALLAVERQLAWLSGVQQRLLAAMTEHSSIDVDGVDREWVREDVACVLRLSAAHRQRAGRAPARHPGLAAGRAD